MSALLAPRPHSLLDQLPLGGEPTLEDVILRAWEGLATRGSVGCPACGAEMQPVYGAPARLLGGRCDGCGTRLA